MSAIMSDLDDWDSFYVIVGSAAGALIGLQFAYVLLALSAFAAPSHTREALFGVGAAALVLLFIGIHNAWDGIAYHVFVSMQGPSRQPRRDDTSEE
jgi:hypothetical protein